MKVTSVFAIAVVGFIACRAAQAMPDDAFSDFSLINNPNGPWSYGYGIPGTSFTAYPSSATNCTGIAGLNCWDVFANSVPYIGENVTGSPIDDGSLTIPTGLLDIHPFVSPYDTIIEWTAPSAGNWQITGFYDLLDTSASGVTALIYAGATQLLDEALTTSNRSVDLSFTEALAAGETLEFAEGPNSSGGYSSDSTGFDVTISSVPEPKSVTLLCTALAGFGVIRRRETAQERRADGRASVGFRRLPNRYKLSDVECFDC